MDKKLTLIKQIDTGDIFSCSFKKSEQIPLDIPITTPFTFPFRNMHFMLCLDKTNYWNPLGGHYKKHENMYDCIEREAYEEGGVSIKDITIFGYLEVVILRRKKLNYPTKSIMPLTYSKIVKIHSDWQPMETKGRQLVNIRQAKLLLSKRDDEKQMLTIFLELLPILKILKNEKLHYS